MEHKTDLLNTKKLNMTEHKTKMNITKVNKYNKRN